MLEYSGYFVVAWLLPVTLQVVVPLGMFAVWSAFSVSRGVVQKAPSRHKQKTLRERRRNSRSSMEKLGEMIVHQGGVALGRVRNISAAGIGIDAMAPAEIVLGDEVVLSCKGKENAFSLQLEPRWRKEEKSGVTFGAAILNHPAGWSDFVNTERKLV